jgi:hypothetical protein
VLKYTDPASQDKEDIPKAMKMIRELLTRVNAESGRAENRFNLKRLHEQLRFRPNERVDLKLTDDGRELIYKGTLKKTPTDPSDIQAYLFDHAMLLVRVKTVGKKEEVKVYRRVSLNQKIASWDCTLYCLCLAAAVTDKASSQYPSSFLLFVKWRK